MNILAVDTSTDILRALWVEYSENRTVKKFSQRNLMVRNHHSEHLVPTLLEMGKELSYTLKDLDLLVCTSGPGSFTGLRIGMSALKGIALAADIPLVSVPTLTVMAKSVYTDLPVLPVIDARKNRFYTTVFLDGERKCDDLDTSGENIIPLIAPFDRVLLTGRDAKKFTPRLEAYTGEVIIDPVEYRDLGFTLVELGIEKFETEGADDMGCGPLYIRKSDAEIALEEKKRREKDERD